MCWLSLANTAQLEAKSEFLHLPNAELMEVCLLSLIFREQWYLLTLQLNALILKCCMPIFAAVE